MGIVAAVVVLPAFISCGANGKSKNATLIREKVTIVVSRSLLPAPIVVAQDRGYFAGHGLEVSIKKYPSGKLALKVMFAGEADLATTATTPVVFTSFERLDFSLLATFVYSHSDTQIIAYSEAAIEKGTDLKGKRIGVDLETTGQFFLGLFLTYNALAISDVEMVDINTADLPTALQNREVDAIAVWQPYAYRAKQILQDAANQLPDYNVYRTTFNLVTTDSYAKQHPGTLERVLKAVIEAAAFIKDNPQESIAVVSESLELDTEEVTTLWGSYIFEVFLDQELLLGLADEARWAIENGLVEKKEVPDFFKRIYLEPLEAVKPEAITLIH